MSLLIVSFIAGILTVAAPCILPLLPVVVGGSLGNSEASRWRRPVIIAVSLGVSVIVFTLLLKASTALLGVPAEVWRYLSGLIVIILGIVYLFPRSYSSASSNLVVRKLNNYIAQAQNQNGAVEAAVTGAALGPVFNSCSPTYLLVVATVLPASFTEGLIYLIAYAVGLGSSLLAIALLGQRLVSKLGWLESSWFKRTIGSLFVLVGLAVIFGLDQSLQEFILDRGWYAPIGDFETSLR